MTAKITDVDAKLPPVKPVTRRQPATKAPARPAALTTGRGKYDTEREPTMVQLVIDDAVKRLMKHTRKNRTGSAGFTENTLFRTVADRLDMTRYARNPEREVEQIRKSLSLLVWELGIVLEDIETFGEKTTTESKK